MYIYLESMHAKSKNLINNTVVILPSEMKMETHKGKQ